MLKLRLFFLMLIFLSGSIFYLVAACKPHEEKKPEDTFKVAQEATPTPQKSLEEIHQEAIIVDTHVDTVLRMLDKGAKLGEWSSASIDIPKMRKGGLDVVFFSIWVDPSYGNKSKDRADELIRKVKSEVAANSQAIEMAGNYTDIMRIVKSGKIAALMGIEGGHAIADQLDNLDYFYNQGVRYLSLTWSNHTNWADSSGQLPKWNGLTDFGKQVVQRMNKLGMLVDVSHSSDATFWDVLKVTKAPIIASHSSTRTLRDHPRNLSDDMLKALAKNGGVTGINFYPKFLTTSTATVKDLVDHIDHAVKMAGIEHVGLGSDYDGIESTPTGLEDVSKLFVLTQELSARGYGHEQIQKILGGNFMRVFEQVLK